ncbi:alpha/beta fold hydrolase [Microbacterium sp. Se5.02b]|uniref:alpha/beta fold hydrolase n=1 Tax=Microbacterium sp. Se5.02b TaxID=2864103 RepID=UPI001C68ABD4|nr:alpha/beta hydrolase [Microbacterium sp. Se5.02b]QYM65398.1 alpha/beta hydrolase [Microbacterium sp. Se5.02b]
MTTPLFVERHPGTGRPVAFLHGLASRGSQDWPESEWAGVFGDRPRVVVDLPAHGASPSLGTAPTSTVLDALATAVGPDEIDLVGYSLGARLAWDLARHPRVSVRRLVLGGLSAGEPFALVDLAAARASVSGGAAPADPLTGMIVHLASQEGNRPAELVDLVEGLASEPFVAGSDGPAQPTLLLGGMDDAMAAGIDDLARLLPDAHTQRVPGDHVAAVHTAEFRAATRAFLSD